MRTIQPKALSAALALALSQSALGAVTTTVIVEFEGDPAAVEMAEARQAGQTWSDEQIENYRADLAFGQDQVLSAITAAGVNYTINNVPITDYTGLAADSIELRYTMVLNGIAMDVPITEVAALNSVPGVKKVHHASQLELNLNKSVDFIHANDLYGGDHALNAFDDLLEGFEGQGINLSVIDSGVEHQHEMFGGDPTAPRLGVAPYSAAVPTNEKIIYSLPLSDPGVEDGFGHGTHVASTAAGYLGFTTGADNIPLNGDDTAVHGVAPQASIMNYPVCSTVGSASGVAGCLTPVIIAALEDSVSPRTVNGLPKPVAHVINLSLGGANGTPTDATAVASSNAALAGAIVVAAAGNDGDNRSIVGSPSTGTHVISVAAATDPGSIVNQGQVGGAVFASPNQHADVLSAGAVPGSMTGLISPASALPAAAGERQDIDAYPMGGTPQIEAGAVAQNYVYVPDGSTVANYPASVQGRIALVENGGLALFSETAQNAFAAGAAAVVLRTTTTSATAVAGAIPAWTMVPEDFDYLIGLMGPNPQSGDISTHPIRLELVFEGESAVAGFSSRGPVAGFGQVKPDLAAPGVNVLAAVPPASVLGALAAEQNGPNYGNVSGTSMASPHVAGAAALIKQANPTWGPGEVRTALINTATPMRDFANNVEDSYGSHNPPIHAQGGGLVHVADAANAKALMGVRGDGVATPTILGSHSFAGEPVLQNLCVSNQSVTVDLVDTRGSGGTYNLSVVDNRGTNVPGAEPFTSLSSVSVAPGGSASFDVGVIIDSFAFGNSDLEEFQFFVVAERDDGTETLSMPVFFRAVPSIPATLGGDVTVDSATYSGAIDAGLTEASAVLGTTTVEVPVEVGNGVFRMVGNLDGAMITSAGYPDYDMRLLDPNGDEVGSSGNIGSIETIDAAITTPGTYTFVIENWAGGPGSYNLEVQQYSAGDAIDASPAVVDQVDIEFDADVDGQYTLSWSGTGDETAFIVEERVNGGSWSELATVSPNTTSLDLNRGNGSYEYRVISHFPGQVCTYIADPSNVVSVEVELREQVTVTQGIAITGATGGSNLTYDITFTNQSGTELIEPIVVNVTPSAPYTVTNADVGSNGFSMDNAVDGLSWTNGEAAAPITIDFDGPASPFFTISVEATGWVKQ